MSASDWIKMTRSLWQKPEVVRISSRLKWDRLRTVGALYRVWCMADDQTQDGFIPHYTFALIDEEVGAPGLCEAMAEVGWLEENAQGVVIPKFERHNGDSAKRRATETERKRQQRSRPQDVPEETGRVSRKKRDQTRQDKTREEQTTSGAAAVDALRAEPFKIPAADAIALVTEHGEGAVRVAIERAKDGKKPRGLLVHMLREGIDPDDIPKPEPPPPAFPSPEAKRAALAAFRQAHPGYTSIPTQTVLSLPNFRAWYESQNGTLT